MRGGRAFCCSALLVIFIAFKSPHGNIFHLNKSLNAHTTVWSAFSGRSSSTSQENHVQDAQPLWSLSHGLTVAFLNINGWIPSIIFGVQHWYAQYSYTVRSRELNAHVLITPTPAPHSIARLKVI